MPMQLIDMEFFELSLVDEPANPGAQVAVVKRKGAGPTPGEQDKEEISMSDEAKRLAEVEAANKSLETQVKDLGKQLAAAHKALQAEGYLVQDGKVEKRADEEFVEIGGDRVLKSSVPAGVLAAIEKQAKQLNDLTEAAEREEVRKSVETNLGNLGGTDDGKAALWSAIQAIADEELRKAAVAVMEKANKAATFLTTEHGTSQGSEDAGAAAGLASLNELVDKYVAEKGVTRSAAYDAVMKTKAGQDAYKASRERN